MVGLQPLELRMNVRIVPRQPFDFARSTRFAHGYSHSVSLSIFLTAITKKSNALSESFDGERSRTAYDESKGIYDI